MSLCETPLLWISAACCRRSGLAGPPIFRADFFSRESWQAVVAQVTRAVDFDPHALSR